MAADFTFNEMPEAQVLVELAVKAREKAYVPYSHFAVGAALLCADGSVYGGANLENAAYTPTNCAERTAFFRAVFEGQRNFSAIAVVGGPEGRPVSEWCTPCGVCRQVIREWCDPDTLREILPMGFGPEDLGESGPSGKAGGDFVERGDIPSCKCSH